MSDGKWIQTTMEVFSRRFLRKQGCPPGYALRAFRIKDGKKDRLVRKETQFKRRRVNDTNVKPLSGHLRVASLDEEAHKMMAPEVQDKALKLRLFTDEGEPVHPGVAIDTLRAETLNGKPPTLQDAEELFLDEIGLSEAPLIDVGAALKEVQILLGKEYKPTMMAYLSKKRRKNGG